MYSGLQKTDRIRSMSRSPSIRQSRGGSVPRDYGNPQIDQWSAPRYRSQPNFRSPIERALQISKERNYHIAIQAAFDFSCGEAPKMKAAADSDRLQNVQFEVIAQMIADRRAPVWNISRRIAVRWPRRSNGRRRRVGHFSARRLT